MKRFLLSGILLGICCGLFAVTDSITMESKVLERLNPLQNYLLVPYKNPSLHFYRYSTSLSTFALRGVFDVQPQAVVQEYGRDQRNLFIDVSSYFLLNQRSRIWGHAYYSNQKREQVVGSETSDYDLLYPYVVADSIGGDLNAETYAFSGGYAYSHAGFTYGLELSYRSRLEYRQIDPRPRNIVADLNVSAGVSYALSSSYVTGVSVGYRHYKQNGDITFYDPLGYSSVLHLNGLGVDYSRFSGKQTAYGYKGNEWRVLLSLLPRAEGSWSSSLGYSYFSFDKMLTALNNLSLNSLTNHVFTGELMYQKEFGHAHRVVAKGMFDYSIRSGVEHLFGSSSDAYLKIADANQFSAKRGLYELNFMYEYKHCGSTWYVEPLVRLSDRSDAYVKPARDWRVTSLEGGVGAGGVVPLRSQLLSFNLGVYRREALAESLNLSSSWQEHYFQRLIHENHSWMVSDRWLFNVMFRADLRFVKLKKCSLFIEGNYGLSSYAKGSLSTHHYELTLGLNI